MRLPVIAAALAALASLSADARPPPGSFAGTYGGSAWFNDAVGGVAVQGSTWQECHDRLQQAINQRANWAVTKYKECSLIQDYVIIKATDVELSHVEVREIQRIHKDLRSQFRAEEFELAVQASFPPANVCE